MHTLKRGTAVVKEFRLVGLDLEKELLSIEFLFKARKAEHAPTLLYKTYPGKGVTYDPEQGICSLRFTEEDTRARAANERVFMDTRIRFLDGTVPETVIQEFTVRETLFGKEEGELGSGL